MTIQAHTKFQTTGSQPESNDYVSLYKYIKDNAPCSITKIVQSDEFKATSFKEIKEGLSKLMSSSSISGTSNILSMNR